MVISSQDKTTEDIKIKVAALQACQTILQKDNPSSMTLTESSGQKTSKTGGMLIWYHPFVPDWV